MIAIRYNYECDKVCAVLTAIWYRPDFCISCRVCTVAEALSWLTFPTALDHLVAHGLCVVATDVTGRWLGNNAEGMGLVEYEGKIYVCTVISNTCKQKFAKVNLRRT